MDQTEGGGEPVLPPKLMVRAGTWDMRPVGVKSLSFWHWESDVLHRQIVIGQRGMTVN